MRKFETLVTLPVLTLFCLGLYVSFGYGQNRDVKLGVLLCQTGDCAATGMAALRGVQLAVDEINVAGGILGRKISISVQDSRDSEVARFAVEAFQSLALDPEIHFFIGPSWSPAGMPLVPFFKSRSDIIIVSPSVGVSDFNEASENIFNLRPPDKIGSQALAGLAIRNGWRKAAVISAQDPWAADQAHNFSAEFVRQGGSVVATVDPLPASPEIRPEILKIVSAKPDVVLFTLFAHMRTAAKYLKQLRYSGGLMAAQLDESMISAAQGTLENTIFCNFPEASPEFTTKYSRRFNERPGLSADTGYDAVYLFEKAVREAGTFEPSSVRQQMLITSWDGASGRITLDSKGGIQRQPKFFKVHGSHFVPYGG